MLCGQALTRNEMIYSTKISTIMLINNSILKMFTKGGIFVVVTIPHTSIIPIAVMDKSGRNVATLWHFALTLLLLLRKVDATHHFVVTLCLHRGEHSSTDVHTYCTLHTHKFRLQRGAHWMKLSQ